MAVTTLDPTTALIVIDLQKAVVGMPTVHPAGEVVARAAALADAFRGLGLPVVLVTATGRAPGRTEGKAGRRPAMSPGMADLVPELKQQPSDHIVAKQTWGAFHGTGLDAYLKNLGVTQVVVVGIATSAGVESTARQAYEHGFNVTLAVDAMTDRDLEVHTNSITRVFPRLGETGTTQEIIDLLRARG